MGYNSDGFQSNVNRFISKNKNIEDILNNVLNSQQIFITTPNIGKMFTTIFIGDRNNLKLKSEDHSVLNFYKILSQQYQE